MLRIEGDGDRWAELLIKAFGDGKDGTHVQQPYAGLSVSPADVAFDVAKPGDEQQTTLTIHNRGTATAVLHGVRCMPELHDSTISLAGEVPPGGAIMPPDSKYEVVVRSTAPAVVGMHYTFVLALIEIEEPNERALITSRVLLGARACLLVTDPDDVSRPRYAPLEPRTDR